jgi:molybdopterin/thiamine biosynthesis adenylyltransferase
VQCAEAVAWLTGKEPFLAGRMLVVDLQQGIFEKLDL